MFLHYFLTVHQTNLQQQVLLENHLEEVGIKLLVHELSMLSIRRLPGFLRNWTLTSIKLWPGGFEPRTLEYVTIALVTTIKNLLQGNTSSSVYNCNFSPWNRPPVVKMSPICFTSFFELRNNKWSSQFKAISVFFTREFLVSPKHLSRRFEFRVFFLDLKVNR